MSMCVDNKETGNHVLTIRPRRPCMWIPDERVLTCFDCQVVFSFFRRKHHCRSCGRVFCLACSSFRGVIPALGPDQQRVCCPCASQLQEMEQVDWLICALSVMPVTFSELFCLRLLNKEWNNGVNLLLGIYRGLQYRLSCHNYSRVEYNFLKTHYQEFLNHTQWQLHAIIAMHQQGTLDLTVTTRWQRRCRSLLCSRTCQPVLSIGDMIRLAPVLHNIQLQRWVVQTWQRLTPGVHVLMMFWWVHLGLQHPRLLKEGLLELCVRRLDLAYALWFECHLVKDRHNFKQLIDIQTCLCSKLKKSWLVELKRTIVFHGMLSRLSRRKTNRSWTGQTVRLPWAPHITICGIGPMEQILSSSRPVTVSLQTTAGESIQCLLKNEDVRTDRLSMVIGHFINDLTTGVLVHTYPVFPLTLSSGCIVMIPGAKTLYSLRKNMTLTNYIMATNEQDTIQQVRQRFVSTCAGACLLAFALGLGDRHLENIMVTPDAHLVHVDFGYVLGEDPKHIRSTMRITDDMVDAMGGRYSDTFALFLLTMKQAYAAMRLYSSLWYQLLSSESLIFQDKKRPLSIIQQHVYDRFVPGEWNEEAELQIEAVVEKASHTSWAQHAVDLVHGASNQWNTLLQHGV